MSDFDIWLWGAAPDPNGPSWLSDAEKVHWRALGDGSGIDTPAQAQYLIELDDIRAANDPAHQAELAAEYAKLDAGNQAMRELAQDMINVQRARYEN